MHGYECKRWCNEVQLYVEDKKFTQIHIQTLHPLRDDFGVSSHFT
jgi:hypothetical protein